MAGSISSASAPLSTAVGLQVMSLPDEEEVNDHRLETDGPANTGMEP